MQIKINIHKVMTQKEISSLSNDEEELRKACVNEIINELCDTNQTELIVNDCGELELIYPDCLPIKSNLFARLI